MGNFNSMIFPRPNPPYYDEKHPKLIWVPRPEEDKQQASSLGMSFSKTLPNIPCLFIPCKESSDKLMIYFHGNAEDIGVSDTFFTPLTSIFKCHVLVMEYPTYGVYKNRTLSEDAIRTDACHVYDFVTQKMGIPHQQIIVFGRSMGSGSACILASSKPVGALILFSAYKSVKEAAKSLVGGFLATFVKDRFKNIKAIKNITCPVYFIHGKKDNVIPYTHTVALYEASTSAYKKILIPENMTHNDFDIENHLIEPILDLLKDNNLHEVNPLKVIQANNFMQYKNTNDKPPKSNFKVNSQNFSN